MRIPLQVTPGHHWPATALAAVLLVVPTAVSGGQASGPALLLDRVQERISASEGLVTRFVQRSLNRFGAVSKEASGDLWIRPPGQMRWEYDDGQLFVASDDRMFLWLPHRNVVQVMEQRAATASEAPILYLAGEGRLLRDFDVDYTDWGPLLRQGNAQISMQPRRDDTSFERLILEVRPSTAAIERLIVVQVVGDLVEYRFEEPRFDPEIPDDTFAFTFPEGAEVVQVGGS